jgi:hypothetical protein
LFIFSDNLTDQEELYAETKNDKSLKDQSRSWLEAIVLRRKRSYATTTYIIGASGHSFCFGFGRRAGQ